MSRHQPTEADGREALRDHLVAKAIEARQTYGPEIDAPAILAMLDDRTVVRYPTGLRFDAEPLEPGEFAWAAPLGGHPEQGYCLVVHPCFEDRPDVLPMLVAYHLPDINYGEVVTAADAELFAATLLGLEVEAYYGMLCTLVDGMGVD
ncbi:MAG: hypothetical protein ACYTJ0_01340 [Planctomycetota bacterium]